MQNFVLHNQTKILFGKGMLDQLGTECVLFGKRVLLVYGMESIKKTGLYDQITELLSTQNMVIIDHGGVVSNPLLSHVRAGVSKAKENKVDLILAVGGGSVIDSAKAISCGACVEHDVWKFFTGKKSIKKTIPLVCVLTLAAAGSEMNGGMVITHDEKRHKFGTGNAHLNPKTSILDPGLTITVPRDYTVYGAIDAIAHICEFYFTTKEKAPVQERFMEGLIINIIDSCNRVLDDLSNYEARADLMWCTTLALNGWTAAGLGLVGFPMHMIEHTLSAHYNVAHGAGLSVVMPGWMNYMVEKQPAKFNQFSTRIFNTTKSDILENSYMGIRSLKEIFRSWQAPVTLAELDIPESALPELARESIPLAKNWRLNGYSEQIIHEILKGCLKL